MATPLLRAASRATGWLMDRRVPTPLRGLAYRTFARCVGADLSEAELEPRHYPSLGAFFVRRLRPGARPLPPEPDAWISPCDGTVQALETIRAGRVLQAKGQPYALDELLAGAAPEGALEGGQALTIYLSPRDYHRVHAPTDVTLDEVRWVPGELHSVAPAVLARRARVLARNERAVLSLSDERGPLWLVMVGALNVGRIRVVGVEPGAARPHPGAERFARGAELARFEMGSTIVLLVPAGRAVPSPTVRPGRPVRLGEVLGRWR